LANGAPPPPPPPPPKPQGKTTGERGIFDRFINSHTALKPYAGQIWADANNAGGITPTELAATLWLESRGNPSASNPSGALGLAQILDTSANPTNAAGVPFFRANRQISRQDKLNPSFAIQYMAWRMSGAVQKYGSLDVAYVKGYNPNFTGTGPSGFLPKGYVGTPNQTVKQTVTKSQQTAGLKNTLNDPWVVETKAGFKYVNSPETPIFTKGKIFYGLDKSKRAILDAGFAIICEGQLDLIACYMAGVKNMVAPQGTAFTPEHARILKRDVSAARAMPGIRGVLMAEEVADMSQWQSRLPSPSVPALRWRNGRASWKSASTSSWARAKTRPVGATAP